MKKINSLKILFVSIILLFAGCNNSQTPQSPKNTITTATKSPSTPTPKPVPEHSSEDGEDVEDMDIIINNLIASMTLEEKVGQLFIVAFRKDEKGNNLYEMNEHMKNQIEKFKIGGVILFSENIDTRTQTSNLIKSMQSVSKIPLFISVDEEGGRISRLGSNPKMGITKLPSAKEIGEENDPDLAYQLGSKLGSELYSLGFNMNFAPVADVNTNPKNPVIGDRAFGSDPQKVGIMVEQIVKGMQEENVSAVLKHFPGHGDASKDSHKGAVIIEHGIERLREIEFVPFEKGISADADAIMTAHIILPEIDSDDLPATLSKKILTGLLRKELNYEGLIITDALEMEAIKKHWPCDKASIMAFKAGADILLMPDSLEKAYNGILDAAINGDITQDSIDKSIYRILKVKYKRGLLKNISE